MRKKRVIALGMAACFLFGCSSRAQSQKPSFIRDVTTGAPKTEALEFPYLVPDSPLVVEELLCYEGNYWEDGSGEYVKNVAGLMVYNPTDRLVEYTAFALKADGKTLYFFVHYLPPGSRCLVLEKNRQPCNADRITQCQKLCIRWSFQELSREQIHYVGLGKSVTVVNREARGLEKVTLRYKRYVPEGNYYLGGTVFSAYFFDIQPFQQRTLQPQCYDSVNAKIVCVDVTHTP